METKITVHRFPGRTGEHTSKVPVRISIVRGGSNRTAFLTDEQAEQLRSLLAAAVHAEGDKKLGELICE